MGYVRPDGPLLPPAPRLMPAGPRKQALLGRTELTAPAPGTITSPAALAPLLDRVAEHPRLVTPGTRRAQGRPVTGRAPGGSPSNRLIRLFTDMPMTASGDTRLVTRPACP